ncbi:MAG: VanW family protein [Candidatus Berkelbacteria bacterium]|nr:VanW family protein [Candidatus Berkelbacteria bacterium]
MKATKTIREKLSKIRQKTRFFLYIFAVSLVGLAGVFIAYQKSYSNKALLNTYILDEKIAGQNQDQIKSAVAKIYDKSKGSKIKLVNTDKSWEISFEDSNWKLDEAKTAQEIFNYGHSSSHLKNFISTLQSAVLKKHFTPAYSFNEDFVQIWLDSVNSQIGKPKKEANIQIKGDEITIINPEAGKTINEDQIKEKIIAAFSLKENNEIKIEVVNDEPTITADEAKALADKAKELTKDDFEIVGPNSSANLTKKTLGLSIELKRKSTDKKGFLGKKSLGEVFVSFSRDKISGFLDQNLDDLNIKAQDAKFTISNGNITLKSPSKDGRAIEVDQSIDKIIGILETGQEKKIELPSKAQEASIKAQTAGDIEKIGIKELIGTATTDFRKSPSNRIHNIETGVQLISGSTIKPGDEFSTLSRLGKIDQSTGFLPELVIKEDKTIPEFGGGLCQVSTTLFRSAMNSGLKITARQNHSYRVSYYEPPVGMDATIYYPSPDFKFINTTNSYILINGHIDGTRITFDFYGTKDGRVVETTDPVSYDVISPPDPIYTDDPSLAPGEVKLTDHAHAGAKAYFYYRVRKDGKLIEDDKFVSSYVAWPAKYLRGPGTPEQQDPQPQDQSTPQPAAAPAASQTP